MSNLLQLGDSKNVDICPSCKGTGFYKQFERVWDMRLSSFTQRQKFCIICKGVGKRQQRADKTAV